MYVNGERVMAYVATIEEKKAIEGADLIEAYRVGGWWVVDKKDAYAVNDKAIYVSIDSWVPHEIAPFLSKGKEPREFNGVKGEKLRTVRLKGQISQGLLLPLSVLNIEQDGIVYETLADEGCDVTEILGIRKWEAPIPACLAGQMRGNFPSAVKKTEAERVQNLNRSIEQWKETGHTFTVMEKVDGCFLGNQLIETWDGESVKIREIVRGNINPTLIGVDSDGNIVPCYVTETFNNGTKYDWIDIHFDSIKKANFVGKSGKLRTTINHKIFTSEMKEVPAYELKQGDLVLMQEPQYCEKAIHYFRSGMLGDGHIGGKGHFSYNESHVTKHSEYMDYIKSIFKNVNFSCRKQISGYGSEIEHIKIFSTNQIKQMRTEWYDENGVKLPEDISWIDDFSVAKWYMDDGSLSHSDKQKDRATFATNAFSENDVNRLAKKLIELYGVDCTVYFSKGWCIRVNYSKGTIHNFWKAVAKHVIPSQRYKLPVEYRDYDFKHYGEVSRLVRKLIPVMINKVEKIEVTKSNFPSGSTGFDIETTTHNYFCGGILVHNSSSTFYLDQENDFHVCSRNWDLKDEGENTYWNMAKKYSIQEKMIANNMQGLAIQGETFGFGLNGNLYKMQNQELMVFSIYDTKTSSYLPTMEAKKIADKLELKFVPIIGQCNDLPTVDGMLSLAEFKSNLNHSVDAEGHVYRCNEDPNICFKAISNLYLIKKGD